MKMKIYNKMLYLIILTALIVFGATIMIVNSKIRSSAVSSNKQKSLTLAKANSEKVKMFMQDYMSTARVLKEIALVYGSLPVENRLPVYKTVFENTLLKNQKIAAIHGVFLSDIMIGFDTTLNISYNRNNKNLGFSDRDISTSQFFLTPRNTLFETMIPNCNHQEPNDTCSLDSYVVPIMQINEFIGVVGVDGKTTELHEYLKTLARESRSELLIINRNWELLSYSSETGGAKLVDAIKSDSLIYSNVSKGFEHGKATFTPLINHNYYAIVPIQMSNHFDKILLITKIPSLNILVSANRSTVISIITGLIGLLVLSVFVWMIARLVTKPLLSITKSLESISMGDISYSNKLKISGNDELSEISLGVNRLIDGLNNVSAFAAEIGKGNLDTKYTLLGKSDTLGQSLVLMRESLIQSRTEENKQRIEDDKQSWVTQGIAKFGEILRINNDNIEILSSNLVKNLCLYMDKPQCAIFVISDNENEDIFDLASVFAFGQFKIITKSVHMGEELIGRVAQDRKTLHITDTPQSFPIIRPELSHDEIPVYSLIVPLLIGEQAIGVVELLGYKAFESHEIEFVEKLGANIASTVNSVKINVKTAELLKQSREQKDILAQHEEEMRQNMEEMLATQEEAEKREHELKTVISTIEANTMLAILNIEGKITKINETLSDLFGFPASQMIGKYMDAFTTPDEISRKEFARLWSEVLAGNSQKKIQKIENRKKSIYLSETYIPILDNDEREVQEVALVATDVTTKVKYDQEIAQLISEIETYAL
ncbi:MAG: PAS domain-containing protein [Salinivirgaceae bacterium]|nr:PAS domain-containing protein [Salinivirgaceae bacterium]